jgi:oligopeptide/dipeptide ABC transporter, ATP-binding protein, C-terminal domain
MRRNEVNMENSLLEIKNLSVEYKGEKTVKAVNGISFVLGRRETIGLVGETGAGKTSTALAIMQLLSEKTGKIPEGEIIYKGYDLLKKTKKEMKKIRGSNISMIFQDPMTSLNPVMTVGDQILESLEIHNEAGLTKVKLNERVEELLAMVGIQPNRKNDYPHEFSGGMKQRVVIAIALACSPELLIADEPTTALDVTIQAQVLAMMEDLKNRMDTSIILITHDMGVVAEICDRVAIMYAGEIVEQGRVEDIFEGKVHHPYTIGLFQAIPDLEEDTKRLHPIDGLMPDPTDLPGGCKFHPRCTHCMEVCKTQEPPVIQLKEHSIMCHLLREEDENGKAIVRNR